VTDGVLPARPEWREGVEDLPGYCYVRRRAGRAGSRTCGPAAPDLGINFFDTANVYGATPTFDRPGAPPATEREPAEQILGRALVGRRDDVVIATKSGERQCSVAHRHRAGT
jgi:aryl-alcohol dehydrogenase-like predicted oxidoreductase